MAASFLTDRIRLGAAKRRLAASSVAPVYASASSQTPSCVISNANAYRFSRLPNAVCSKGDR
jgi:hypothetical protein